MSLASLENEIVRELKTLTGNRKLTKKNIMEWRTSKLEAQDGEKVAHIKSLGVFVAYKEKLNKVNEEMK